MIGSFAIAAAVVAAAVIAIGELDKAFNKNALAAAEAEKASQKLNAAYGEAKTKYEDLM